MNGHDDKYLEALQGMWSEMKAVNGRIDKTNENLEDVKAQLRRLDEHAVQTNDRLDSVNGRLDSVNDRLDLHGKGIVKLIDEVAGLNSRFDNFFTGEHHKEHDDLRKRVEQLEKHTGLR